MLQAYKKSETIIFLLTLLELTIEKIFSNVSHSKRKSPKFYLAISCFELLKFVMRVQEFLFNCKRQIYISENIPNDSLQIELHDEIERNLFNFENEEASDFTAERKKLIEEIEEISLDKHQKFNSNYEELLPRSKKVLQTLKTFPLNSDILAINNKERKEKIMIFLGEMIFLAKPLINSLTLLFSRKESYRAYLIGVVLEVARLFLQRNILFHSENERREINDRNRNVLINLLLRNPFYTNVLKNRLLKPMTRRMGERSKIVFYYIFLILELRGSLALVL